MFLRPVFTQLEAFVKDIYENLNSHECENEIIARYQLSSMSYGL
jgi:hypothetical protein